VLRQRSRGERAGDEHRDLAANRQQGVDGHNHRDRQDAVVAHGIDELAVIEASDTASHDAEQNMTSA